MGSFNMTLDFRAMDEALSKLPEKVQGNFARKALRAGGNVILGALLDNTPVMTEAQPGSDALAPGEMKAHATTTVQISTKGEVAGCLIGFDSDVAHVARFVNNGHDIWTGGRGNGSRKKGKRGKFRGRVEGKHFIERAFDESAAKAVDVMLTTLGESLMSGSAE